MKVPVFADILTAAQSSTGQLECLPMYYGGKWHEAADGATFESFRPGTGAPWAEIVEAGPEDVALAVTAARQAFENCWEMLSPADRARVLWKIARIVDEHRHELAVIESADNGKALRETEAELDLIVRYFEFFGGVAQCVNGDTLPRTGSALTYTRREPIGVVGAVIPWNSPLVMLAWKMCPALAGGNTIVLKTAEDTPVSALAFASLVHDVVPPGVLNIVPGYGSRAGEALVTDHRVDKLAFTGSTETGRKIAALAAETVKPVTLELGGKSPSLVFADADLDAAVMRLAYGIFSAGGQSCMAASRVLVHSSVSAEFVRRLSAKADAIRVGDPLDRSTHVGAQTSARQLTKIEEYVSIGASEGAVVVSGGERAAAAAQGGYFYRPTVFAKVDNAMRVCREEIFGPVVCVLEFDSEDEAVEIANDSPYGLAGSVWTSDVKRAHRVSERLRVGTVWINNYRLWNWLTPFGGYKQSGYGRENGLAAMEHYTQLKSVWIDLNDKQVDWFA